MPSKSYRRWTTTRARALDEILQAHAAVGGTARGRRYTTQQINQAFAVVLASHFQGFCRDLHSECADHIASAWAPTLAGQELLRHAFTWNRQLDRGNAQPSSLNMDFARLGIDLWQRIENQHRNGRTWRDRLELMNRWRNAIAHQDFDPTKLGGTILLQLGKVRQWRRTCQRLARALDQVLAGHLRGLTNTAPW